MHLSVSKVSKAKDVTKMTSDNDEGIFMDLVDNMPTDAWQSSVAVLLCMTAICAAFMFDLRTVIVVATIIASIISGTLGTLGWEGIAIDPIMMAALVISIGFSVDIPAHVSYHYHSSSLANDFTSSQAIVRARLVNVLSSVGIPAIQASISTSICVLALLFIPLYMAQIFVRIMCSCICLCLLHSLIILPILFFLIGKLTDFIKNSKSNN